MADGDIFLTYIQQPTAGRRPFTARGLMMLSWLPVQLRDTPEFQAVIHAQAKEFDRLEAAREEVRKQALPTMATLLLPAWETVLKLPVNPAGMTVEQRQARVLAQIALMGGDPSGRAWVQNVSLVAGAGWTYAEHDPDDPDSPDENTLLVTLPYAPDDDVFLATVRLLDVIKPAHVTVIVSSADAFIWDAGQFDVSPLL